MNTPPIIKTPASGPKAGDLIRIIRPPSPEERSLVGHVCLVAEVLVPKSKLIVAPGAPKPMPTLRVVVLSPRGEAIGVGELPLLCAAPEASEEWKNAKDIYTKKQTLYSKLVEENEVLWKAKVEEVSKEVSVPPETLDKVWRSLVEFYTSLDERVDTEMKKFMP